jgi:hypothetical protein
VLYQAELHPEHPKKLKAYVHFPYPVLAYEVHCEL